MPYLAMKQQLDEVYATIEELEALGDRLRDSIPAAVSALKGAPDRGEGADLHD